MVYSPSFCLDGNLSNAQVSNPFIDLKLLFRFLPSGGHQTWFAGKFEFSPKTWRCCWENHQTNLSIFQQTMFHYKWLSENYRSIFIKLKPSNYRRGTQRNGRHDPNCRCPNFPRTPGMVQRAQARPVTWFFNGLVRMVLSIHPWIHSEANVYDDRSMLKMVISPVPMITKNW